MPRVFRQNSAIQKLDWSYFLFLGVWGIFTAILNLGWLITYPIWWITLLAGSIVKAVLGFMLGYGMVRVNLFYLKMKLQRKKTNNYAKN